MFDANKLISGNSKAFEDMLFTYERAIFSYIFRLTSQKPIAEDLTQDTFIKVYQNRNSIDLNKNFKAWLYTIATNTVNDYFRKQGRSTELYIIDDPNADFETKYVSEAYQYSTEHREVKFDLDQALDQLPPHYRKVLLLHYYEGFSYEEIADISNVPINTVKTHMRRAKESLQNILGPSYADTD